MPYRGALASRRGRAHEACREGWERESVPLRLLQPSETCWHLHWLNQPLGRRRGPAVSSGHRPRQGVLCAITHLHSGRGLWAKRTCPPEISLLGHTWVLGPRSCPHSPEPTSGPARASSLGEPRGWGWVLYCACGVPPPPSPSPPLPPPLPAPPRPPVLRGG